MVAGGGFLRWRQRHLGRRWHGWHGFLGGGRRHRRSGPFRRRHGGRGVLCTLCERLTQHSGLVSIRAGGTSVSFGGSRNSCDGRISGAESSRCGHMGSLLGSSGRRLDGRHTRRHPLGVTSSIPSVLSRLCALTPARPPTLQRRSARSVRMHRVEPPR
eukprot:7330904-Prymnesium_polylepis.2